VVPAARSLSVVGAALSTSACPAIPWVPPISLATLGNIKRALAILLAWEGRVPAENANATKPELVMLASSSSDVMERDIRSINCQRGTSAMFATETTPAARIAWEFSSVRLDWTTVVSVAAMA